MMRLLAEIEHKRGKTFRGYTQGEEEEEENNLWSSRGETELEIQNLESFVQQMSLTEEFKY